MISLLLLAMAIALLFGVDADRLKAAVTAAREKVTPKQLVAAALIVAAVAMLPLGGLTDEQPTPEPEPVVLDLRGQFKGSTASEDASIVGNLCLELADELEFDATQPSPIYTTGMQVDNLRKAARLLRCRGESIGDRQPAARDVIATYLDDHVGAEGGPLTPSQRSAWIAAFRDIGRAACDAAE